MTYYFYNSRADRGESIGIANQKQAGGQLQKKQERLQELDHMGLAIRVMPQ